MEMRHETRLIGNQCPEIVVDLGGIERSQAQSRQFGNRVEQVAA